MPALRLGSPPLARLLPREHGAYVQLGLALAAGLFLGHGYPRAWGQALLTLLVFLASGPLLLLRGGQSASRGWRLLALLAALALGAGLWVWWKAPSEALRSLLIPTLLASALLTLLLAKREHTILGELLAAWALSSSAYPVAILGGAGPREAALLALTLAVIQSIGTITVRAFLESLKRGDQPLLRIIPCALGMAMGCLGLSSGSPFAWTFALALVPNTAIAAWLLIAPPSPRRMKHLGWMLTLASMAGLLPVLLALNKT